MIRLRHRASTGEERPWTLREIVQGQPLGHPSHPMFVHFPVAYYIAVLAFDLLTQLHPDSGLVFAGTLLIIGGFIGGAFAVTTGLVDWFQMIGGSRKRRKATQHMLLQLSTFPLFVAALAMRWGSRHAARAAWSWIGVEAVAVAVLVVGQYLGGVLVYEMAMRVRTGRA